QLYYYSYISHAQSALVQRVKSDLSELALLRQASEKRAFDIGQLKDQQVEAKNQLETEQSKRRQVLGQLSNQINDQRKAIERLKRNEQHLTQLVEEINRMLAKRRVDAQTKNNKKSAR